MFIYRLVRSAVALVLLAMVVGFAMVFSAQPITLARGADRDPVDQIGAATSYVIENLDIQAQRAPLVNISCDPSPVILPQLTTDCFARAANTSCIGTAASQPCQPCASFPPPVFTGPSSATISDTSTTEPPASAGSHYRLFNESITRVTITFPIAGSYEVSASATDCKGLMGKASITVVVQDQTAP